jgi:hypothetical protein
MSQDIFATPEPINDPVNNPNYARAFGLWWREGLRTGFFLRPRWDGLHTGPAIMAWLVGIIVLMHIGFQRLYFETGPIKFQWQAFASGWLLTVAYAWASYLVRGKDSRKDDSQAAPDAAHLFTALLAQDAVLFLIISPLGVAIVHHFDFYRKGREWATWAFFLVPLIWYLAAQLLLLWRGSDRSKGAMFAASLALVCSTLLVAYARPSEFWQYDYSAAENKQPKQLKLTQAVMEAQPQLLAKRLSELKPQRRGVIDLYAITYAPYGDDVFRRESGMVAQVMTQRFDAGGHVLQLVNHVDTVGSLPWATPLNLERTIAKFAQVMDKNEDILFIHLTSHGGADGKLASYFWPMEVEPLQPAQLKRWLDKAGIRNRVISISACFSGSWIEPLANADTLVLTAADADHTSYGCGSKSDLTFFGRAMYDEQLRNSTLSFEQAYAVARKVIEKREIEAGKDDGFSNPQMRMGERIRGRLAALIAGLPKKGDRPKP